MSAREWKEVRLGDSGITIVDGDRGKNYPKKSEFTNKGFCIFLGTNNLIADKVDLSSCDYISEERHNLLGKGIVKRNDIILTSRGNGVGKLGIYKYSNLARINSGLVIIRNETNLFDSMFLYYMFTSTYVRDQFKELMSGSAQPQLPIRDLKKVKLIVPSILEQKSIAILLDALDEKIEINNQINKNLEETAQAIFKRWFIDFEFPNESGEPYKSSGGEMVESEMGLIPKWWRIKPLDKIANYLNGLAMQKYRPSDNERGIPVLKIKELRQGYTDSSSELASENIDKNYIINDGDVIFSWSGSLLVDIWCGGISGLNQHLFKVTSETYNKWFYYLWTKHHLDTFIRIAESKATTMGHIKRSDLENANVIIPDEDSYKVANGVLKPLYEKIINIRIENRNLANLRDSLLPKLMSGEIRVPLKEI